MRRLWTEDRVTYKGKIFTIEDLGIGLKPLRPGGPPIWIAGVVDAAVKRAAQIGDAWLITNFAHLSVLVPQMKLYRETLGREQAVSRRTRRSRASAMSDRPAPRRSKNARPRSSTSIAAYSSWGLDKQSEGAESFQQPFEEFVKDRFIIGDKAFVRTKSSAINELLGVNHFIMRVQWPGLAHDKVLRTIATLGEILRPDDPASAADLKFLQG